MKELIKHLFENNYEQIAQRSLKNCHTIGLHSIMLLESPEKTIRLYVTDYAHNLNKNRPGFSDQSLAFHAHHCNLTLHVVKGDLTNLSATFVDTPVNTGLDLFDKYRYKSKISDGELSFELLSKSTMITLSEKSIMEGESFTMSAKDIHTVWCRKNSTNAWLVYEGKEDPKYEPICYTKSDPNAQVSDQLYHPMTIEEAFNITKNIGLL